MSLSVGGIGMVKEEVTFVGAPMLSREAALAVMRAFLVPEDMGTPPGAIALRGATNFQTPPGWDTVYTPIFNMIERPVAPMLVVRVETDWYAHETEFRYVLQAGEGITRRAQHPDRAGVLRAARGDHDARTAPTEELKAIEESRQEFNQHKAAATQQTSYGLTYSPHYLRQSRAQKSEGEKCWFHQELERARPAPRREAGLHTAYCLLPKTAYCLQVQPAGAGAELLDLGAGRCGHAPAAGSPSARPSATMWRLPFRRPCAPPTSTAGGLLRSCWLPLLMPLPQ